jgi:hypothetical protein
VAIFEDPAGIGMIQPRHDPHHCRLAGLGQAQQHIELAPLEGEVHIP